MKKTVKLIGLILLCFPVLGFSKNLSDDSIYHVGSVWKDQNGKSFSIEDLQGRIQVTAFVYTYCEHSCPVILAKLKELKALLPEGHEKQIQFLLISLDPKRDTPQILNEYMQDKKLNPDEWLMLNGSPDDVLELSALIGVKYKPMDTEGKDFAHSNMITVLDKKGRIHHQMKGLNEDLDDMAAIVDKLLSDDLPN